MFEWLRQKRAERLMQQLDDTPVTDETFAQRNTLMEKLGKNQVAVNWDTEEYVSQREGNTLRSVNLPGTERDRTRKKR